MSLKITGLEKLQRELEDARGAFQSLEGTIATFEFDPNSQASVDAAIRDMEKVVDAKVMSYRGNALVEKVAKGLKQQYRTAILERAEKARHRTHI